MPALLPVGLRPYAKFIHPAVASLLGLVAYGLIDGRIDVPQLEVGLVGLVAATLSFVVANDSAGVGRYAKALTPAVLTVAAVAVHAVVTGELDQTEWVAAATGLIAATITLLTPNTPTPYVDGVTPAQADAYP